MTFEKDQQPWTQSGFAEIERLKPSLIIAASDPGVVLADHLASRLTPHFSNRSEQTNARRNKGLAYERLAEVGLTVPFSRFARSEIEAVTIAQEIFRSGSLVVVKPPDVTGTDGFTKCSNISEVRRAFKNTFGRVNSQGKTNRELIVSEFIEGPEFAVQFESTVRPDNGQVEHVLTDALRYLRDGPDGSRYDKDDLLRWNFRERDQILPYAHAVLNALGVRFGPSHVEIKISSRGPVLIDPNIRMCGAKLPRVVKRLTGYSQIEGTHDAYFDPWRLLEKANGYSMSEEGSVIFIRAIRDGVFRHNEIEKLRNEYGSTVIPEVIYQFPDGAKVTETRDSDSTLGQLTVIHPDRKVIESIHQRLRAAESAGLVVH